MTVAKDAAVLYFALHGTDAPLTCQHLTDDFGQNPSTRCGLPLVGVAHDDGSPLCEEHLKEEGGHPLDFDTIAELWLVRKTLESLGQTPGSTARKTVVARSNLESFALRVAGFDPHDQAPMTPRVVGPKHTTEARLRGYRR